MILKKLMTKTVLIGAVVNPFGGRFCCRPKDLRALTLRLAEKSGIRPLAC